MFVNVDHVRQGSNRIALARIDAVVSARLGPARVRGNAQPAAFHRQIAMYLAHRVGGWSTTRIGRFYNVSFAKNMSDLEALLHQSISERGESG
jgi:hypothetical protein